jgi:hypothetical protein
MAGRCAAGGGVATARMRERSERLWTLGAIKRSSAADIASMVG